MLALCPKESGSGVFRLESRGQEAILALGVYFLESKLQVWYTSGFLGIKSYQVIFAHELM